MYKSKTSLNLHQRLECGKEPMFSCPFCPKKCHQKGNLKVHVHSKHKSELLNCSMESLCSVRSDEHEWGGSNGTSWSLNPWKRKYQSNSFLKQSCWYHQTVTDDILAYWANFLVISLCWHFVGVIHIFYVVTWGVFYEKVLGLQLKLFQNIIFCETFKWNYITCDWLFPKFPFPHT